MGFDAPLAELLACPSCGTRLTGAGCLACRVDFPSIGGIPWLLPEPRLALTEWRGRLHHLLTHYAAEAARQRAGLDDSNVTPMTRARIDRVAAALDDQAARIRELMRPLGIAGRNEAPAVHAALGTELPVNQGLTTYYPNLHRDWCWGDEENRASLEAVVASLPAPCAPRRILVLGAGACRLAYDLHQLLRPSLTVALDFNPFFLLAAARILAGPPLELYEFPIAPRSIEDHAQLRVHAAPEPPAPGFVPVLADASAPPFRPGQFDLVLTPWFIDVAGEPVSQVARRVNSLLRSGRTLGEPWLARLCRCRTGTGLEPRGARGVTAVGRFRPRGAARVTPALSRVPGQPARARRIRHHVLRTQGTGRAVAARGPRTAAVDPADGPDRCRCCRSSAPRRSRRASTRSFSP